MRRFLLYMKIEYTHQYSEIEGLQSEKTVTYLMETLNEGIKLTVTLMKGKIINKESCVCRNIDCQRGMNILKFLYENSVEINNWFDVLNNCDVEFNLV